jgi:tryptophan-rich sensory protein
MAKNEIVHGRKFSRAQPKLFWVVGRGARSVKDLSISYGKVGQTLQMASSPRAFRYFSLALFLILAVGGGLAIGATNPPGAWYAGLSKPAFNPPNWLFPPVWTVLYVLIAVAGWRTFLNRPKSAAMAFWWIQLALNFIWSPVMFTGHAIGAALAVMTLLLLSTLTFITVQWRRDRISATLFVPYAAWVGFACLLNLSLYKLNG